MRHYPKVVLACYRLYCSKDVSVFSYVMTGYRRPRLSAAPAPLRLVYSPKPCLVLEHQPHFSSRFWLRLLSCFQHVLFNFFEASHASSLAAFGCRDLGITFRHPCRFSSMYIYPRPVSFPRTSSNAFLISCAVTTCPASAALSNRPSISFSCSSLSACLCPVYLFCFSPSSPSASYRLYCKYMLL